MIALIVSNCYMKSKMQFYIKLSNKYYSILLSTMKDSQFIYDYAKKSDNKLFILVNRYANKLNFFVFIDYYNQNRRFNFLFIHLLWLLFSKRINSIYYYIKIILAQQIPHEKIFYKNLHFNTFGCSFLSQKCR